MIRALSLLTAVSTAALAAPDSVDTTFAASAGQVFDATEYGGIASVLVQPDGKIVFGSNEMPGTVNGTAINTSLIRFNPDGTVDNIFAADNDPNGSGTGIYYDDGGWPEIHALGIDSTGRIIAAGVLQGMRDGVNSLASQSIVRINANGTLDTTFQTAGTTAGGGFNFIEDVTVQPDDKIIACGGFSGIKNSASSPAATRYGIARFNTNGSVDTTFAINPADFGVDAAAPNFSGFFRQAALDAAGNLYVVGDFEWGTSFPRESVQVFARLFPNGARDTSFVPTLPPGIKIASGCVVEPSGNITFMGYSDIYQTQSVMVRFQPSGALDPTFTLAPTLGRITSRPLQIDPNGRYLVATNQTGSQDVLLRLNNDGSIDPTFTANSSYIQGPTGAGVGYFGTFTTSSTGKIYSGSGFDTVNGVSTKKVVAFEGDSVPNAPGSIQFAAHAFSATEQSGNARIAITRTGGTTGAASATFSITALTATAADYTPTTVTVNFASGIGGTKYVDIPITDDALVESPEVATLSLTGITGAAAGALTSANLTILDSDSLPQIVLQPQTLFIPPANSFFLNVGVLPGANPTTYQWFRNGTAIPGATSALYFVKNADSALHNGDYTVKVTNPNGTTTSSIASVTVKNPASLAFSASSYSAVENSGSAMVTITRSGSSVGPVSVVVSTADGSAASPGDYTSVSTIVSWADGDSTAKTVTVPLINDALAEPSESLTLSLSSFSLDSIPGAVTTATLTLLDDDSGAVVTVPVKPTRAVLGWPTSLSVTAESQTAATYQWFKDGVLLPGETASTLNIAATAASDFGLYSVQITNSGGTVTSGPVELGERPNPLVQRPVLGGPASSITYVPISRAAGGYYVPGGFTAWNAPAGQIPTKNLVRILADGTPDPTFIAAFNGTPFHLGELSEGSIIAGGNFTTYGGVATTGIVKLKTDASLDAAFHANVGSSYPSVNQVHVDPQDRILITYGSPTALVRLLPTGVPDTAFNANIAALLGSINTANVLPAPGGGYYLSGNVTLATAPAGQGYRSIIRINENGTLDTTFTAYTNIGTARVQSDGKIVFASSTLQRLNTDGTLDTTFTPVAGVSSGRFTVAADDSIYFKSSANGSTVLRHHLADGTPDTAFNAGATVITSNSFNVLSSLASGEIYLDTTLTHGTGTVSGQPAIITGELKSVGITTQPLDTIADPNETVVLRVVASSTTPLTYQWRKNGVPIPGATTSVLSLTSVTPASDGDYDVVVTGATATRVSDAARLIVRDAPVIVSSPTGAVNLVGNSITLTVDAVALAPATIQWFRNGVLIPGENGTTLTLSSPTAADSGSYTAKVTNTLGFATTTPAFLDIIPDPAGMVAGFVPATSGFGSVSQIIPEPGGAYIQGGFNSFNHPTGALNNYFDRVDLAGAPKEPFTVTANQGLNTIVRDSTGHLVAGGSNFTLNGVSNRKIVRLAADGTVDTTYTTNATSALSSISFSATPGDLAVDSSDRVYIGGFNFIARLKTDGTLDTTFPVPSNFNARTLRIDGAGRLLAMDLSKLLRFNSDGSADTTFTLDPSITPSSFADFALTPSGGIALARSDFSASQAIHLLNESGGVTGSVSVPYSTFGLLARIAVQDNDKIIVLHGTGKQLTRLLPNGSTDPLFNVGTGFKDGFNNASVVELVLLEDGRIWVGGQFTKLNDVPAYGYVLLNGDPVDIIVSASPTDLAVDQGQPATFSISATGLSGASLSYQWAKDGAPIAGATGTTYSIPSATDGDEAAYTVTVTNTVTGRSRTTSPAELLVLGTPEILASPTAMELEVGDALTLSVDARGAGTLGYQWFRNNISIPGANGPTYSIDPVDKLNAGSYTVRISNSLGILTTEPVVVNVTLSPAQTAPGRSNITFNGAVKAVLPLPDGRTLVGGDFTMVQDSVTNGFNYKLVLINADDTVDRTFTPLFNGAVNSLVLAPDGGVFVGGSFSSLFDVQRPNIARLKPDLTLDTAWAPVGGPNNLVNALAVAPGGKLYVGGQFSAYGGDSNFGFLVRLNADASLDTSFSPPALNTIYDILVLPGGKVLAGGAFTLANSNYLARFETNGSQDAGFASELFSNRFAFALAALPDGGFVAGTRFGNLYRYDASGTRIATWAAQANNDILDIAVEQDGQILVGGTFTQIAGTDLNRIARLNDSGSPDPTFTVGAGAGGAVRAIALEPLGRIHLGGDFISYRGNTAIQRHTVLAGDPLDLAITQQPLDLAVEPGGDATFTVGAASSGALSYQWHRNGSPLADGGKFSGVMTASLTIAAATDAEEDTYEVVVSSGARALTSSSASLVVLGAPEILAQPEAVTTEHGLSAQFSVTARGAAPLSYQWYLSGDPIPGATESELELTQLEVADSGPVFVRISNGLGSVDSSSVSLLVQKLPAGIDRSVFLPAFNTNVNAVLPLDDGNYIVGGNFSNITHSGGFTTRRYLAKLSEAGALDLTFPQVSGSGTVEAVEIDPSTGKIYIGGSFTSISTSAGATSRTRIARINPDGTMDDTFAAAPNGTVSTIRVLPSGKIMIAGSFSNVGGATGTAYTALLDSSGAVDSSFTSQSNNVVNDLAPAADGTVWAGLQGSWGLQSNLARVDLTGAMTPSTFYYGGGRRAETISITADGGALLGFGSYPFIHKVSADGTLDNAWPAAGIPSSGICSFRNLGPNRMLVSGTFNQFGTTAANNLVVLKDDGSLDPAFDSGLGFGGNCALDMRTDSLGRIWMGGTFTTYRGETANRLVVINGFGDGTSDPFESFVAGLASGQQGENDDPDGDGFPNLIEFLFGTNPAASSARPDPVASGSTVSGGSLNGTYGLGLDPAKTYRLIEIEVPTNLMGMVVDLEASQDLSFSGDATTTQVGTPTPNGSTETRRYVISPAVEDAATMFWRLAATR